MGGPRSRGLRRQACRGGNGAASGTSKRSKRRASRPSAPMRSSATQGVQINAIVKSGGNDFHGGGNWAQTDHHFQSNNIDDRVEGAGHRDRQQAREASTTSAGTWGPHRPEQAVVLRGAAPALPRRSGAERLQAGWVARRRCQHAVVAHRKGLVAGQPVATGSSASTRGSRTQESGRADELVAYESREAEDRQDALCQGGVGRRARQLAHRLGPVRCASVSAREWTSCGSGVGRRDLVTERITGDASWPGRSSSRSATTPRLADLVQTEFVSREPRIQGRRRSQQRLREPGPGPQAAELPSVYQRRGALPGRLPQLARRSGSWPRGLWPST